MSQTGTTETREFFRKSFGNFPARVVQAPGRLELLGNHTDYNGGLVMSLAVDKYVYFAASPRTDGIIELASSSFPQREKFYLDKIEKNPNASWANYVKGVLLELRKRGVHFTGFNGVVHGTIPFGAGLSSSAALEIATALIVREMFPYSLAELSLNTPPGRDGGQLPRLDNKEKLQLAKVGQAAENKFVGVNCGLLDQISSLFGKESHVIQIDFLHTSVEHSPLPPNLAVVVADSGVKHELSGGEYNELRDHCEAAAGKLGVKFLRSVTMDDLQRKKGLLTEREYQCAYHIVGENQRVVFGERALRQDDIDQFGQYLFQSHESSRDYFKNSTKELDTLVEIARTIPGCYGARLTGGGFGGATINLVRQDKAEAFSEAIAREYEKRTGIKSNPFTCRVVEGAH